VPKWHQAPFLTDNSTTEKTAELKQLIVIFTFHSAVANALPVKSSAATICNVHFCEVWPNWSNFCKFGRL